MTPAQKYTSLKQSIDEYFEYSLIDKDSPKSERLDNLLNVVFQIVEQDNSMKRLFLMTYPTPFTYGLFIEALKSKNRQRFVSDIRALVMYFMRNYCEMYYKEIGHFLGGRDHSTVMYAVQKVDDLNSLSFANPVSELFTKIDDALRGDDVPKFIPQSKLMANFLALKNQIINTKDQIISDLLSLGYRQREAKLALYWALLQESEHTSKRLRFLELYENMTLSMMIPVLEICKILDVLIAYDYIQPQRIEQ